MNIVLRTRLAADLAEATIEAIVHEVDRSVPIVRFRAMDEVFADSIRRPRLLAQLLGAFAGLALLLAAIGTYGVLVLHRRPAPPRDRHPHGARRQSGAAVLREVMNEGLQLTLFGIVLGLAGAWCTQSLHGDAAVRCDSDGSLTLIAVVPTIALVAGIACALPAWRASRLDPAVVFRDSE